MHFRIHVNVRPEVCLWQFHLAIGHVIVQPMLNLVSIREKIQTLTFPYKTDTDVIWRTKSKKASRKAKRSLVTGACMPIESIRKLFLPILRRAHQMIPPPATNDMEHYKSISTPYTCTYVLLTPPVPNLLIHPHVHVYMSLYFICTTDSHISLRFTLQTVIFKLQGIL